MHKKRNVGLFFLAIILTLIIHGCAKPNENPDVEKIPGKSETDADTPPQQEREFGNAPVPAVEPVINPLTGMPANDLSLLERKPVMVKVSNHPPVGRPHAGLSYADIIFDYYIGSGQNRFMAVFYGQDAEKIGPVRSGRRVDAELVTMYSGILGYGSADADTDAVLVNTLGNYAISHLEGPCPAFCGEETHSATGVFANSAAISSYVNAQGWENGTPDLPGMLFSEQPLVDMQPAEQLTILFNYYNRGEWHYDSATGKYLRWIEHIENYGTLDESMQMIPLTDRTTGEQLAFSNVIVIFAMYNELAPSAHEIEIWGNNNGLPAYLFRDGGMVGGEWASPNDTDPMQFTNADGTPMALKPGNTWIAIMGLSSSFREIQPGQWETFFFLP